MNVVKLFGVFVGVVRRLVLVTRRVITFTLLRLVSRLSWGGRDMLPWLITLSWLDLIGLFIVMRVVLLGVRVKLT